MRSRWDETPRLPHDRDRHVVTAHAAEPRNPDMNRAENATPRPGPHAGFDDDLNPIDDELINTHGSER
jgi:hypothetical protein